MFGLCILFTLLSSTLPLTSQLDHMHWKMKSRSLFPHDNWLCHILRTIGLNPTRQLHPIIQSGENNNQWLKFCRQSIRCPCIYLLSFFLCHNFWCMLSIVSFLVSFFPFPGISIGILYCSTCHYFALSYLTLSHLALRHLTSPHFTLHHLTLSHLT